MTRLLSIGLLVIIAVPFAASAHRTPECLTTVRPNPSTGTVEIVHRLHAHDAELALAAKLGAAQVSLDNLASQARLALYVEERFEITDAATKQPIRLTLIGATLDGDYALVFQETRDRLPKRLSVRNDILREAIDGQVNRVNVFFESGLRSLLFRGDDVWKTTE